MSKFCTDSITETPDLKPSAINSRPPSQSNGTGSASLREMLESINIGPTTDSSETWWFLCKCWGQRQYWKETLARYPLYPSISSTPAPYRPTRLIEIDDNGLKLSLASGRSSYEEYATLSYRWEDSPPDLRHDPSQLSRDRIVRWTQAIEESVLPQTYRDAIYVARQFGIRYLWIDAL